MTIPATLERLEQELVRLPIRDQLRLIGRMIERLAVASLEIEMPYTDNIDELLTMCDTAAEMWDGAFDAAHEIRQIRQQRDEQIWPTKS